MIISFTGISKGYNGKNVFENLSGQINNGDKIGLIGVNGIGKTTLVNLLAGKEKEDAGEIRYSLSDIKILYIQQYPEFEYGVSVYEDAIKFLTQWNPYKKLEDYEPMVRRALNRVGLDEEKWEQQATNLSGGEKTKLILSRIFACDFDLLILDEPTNHLDLESYLWLEEFIKGLDKPMLTISHDRFFLDNTVNRIWELTSKGLKVYEGNYSNYRVQKEIELKSIAREYEKQQTRIQELKVMISDRENWYHRAHRSAGQNDYLRARAKKQAGALKAKKTQLKRLERERVEKPRKELSPAFDVINKNIIDKKFPKFLIQGRNISKNFEKKQILKDISFNVKRGERIAVIGANGSGKSTFLKILCGLYDEYTGTLRIVPSVNIAYFSQELEDLDYESTIIEELLVKGSPIQDVRLLLASLLFRGDDVYKKIGNLSMGEKGRVAFAKLILSGANLLVLDELTNYMDIESREKVEEALEQFEGSIIFVSHDRYFIKRLADRIFVIENKKLHSYDGNYEYYLAKIRNGEVDENKEKKHRDLKEDIMKLEVELAYLGGKLDETLDHEEKEELNRRYLEIAKELNQKRKEQNYHVRTNTSQSSNDR